MFNIRWQPVQTRAELERNANPASAGQNEALPWFLYDTQDIVTAVTTPLTFFAGTQSDPSLGNMKSAGQLPDPQYFIVHYVTCDLLVKPTLGITAAVTGGLSDIAEIIKTSRANFTINLSDKLYGQFPLSLCHSTGGETGGIMAMNNTAAPTINNLQWGNNGNPGSGGFPIGGALVIPPKVGFSLVVNFGTAPTLSATVKCRMGLAGVLYRRVL
jgi:hypothetical protein